MHGHTTCNGTDTIRTGGIVLCGGTSRRMGQGKPNLLFGSECLLARVVRIVGETVAPIVVAARPGQSLPSLPGSVITVTDRHSNAGPMAGVYAGLDALKEECEAAFVVACDHALLLPSFVELLVRSLENYDAVIPRHQGRLYPLTAVYRTRISPMLLGMLNTGEFCAKAVTQHVNTRILDADQLSGVDPRLDSLRNANDPGEFALLLDRAAQSNSLI